MNLKLYTYNTHAINDTTNYNGFISSEIKLQGDARIIQVMRSGRRPAHAAKVLSGYEMKIVIEMKGTVATQIDTLKTWFDIEDEVPHKLICKDIANSNKQWYVYATTKDMPTFKSKDSIVVILSISDPVWLAETETSDSWGITASGQTHAVTAAGNLPARPRFVLTPTASAGSRYAHRRLAVWRNPNTAAMLNESLNIVNTVWDTAALVAVSAIHVTINDGDGITDSDTTITYDGKVGAFPASGMAYLGTEQISYAADTGTQLTGVVRGINGTAAAVHADDVVIYPSVIQADGNDVRTFVGGLETNRWLQDMNTANTKVWIAINFQPGVSLTLDTAIAATGAVGTITFKKTKANKAALKLLPPSGQALIQNELYTYTGVDVNAYKLTGCTRAVKGTSMASHATLTAIYWIEHEIYVYYGNQTADAPATDDTRKPMFDLTSTNAVWDYTSFYDVTGLRPGSWKPSIVKTLNTKDLDNKSNYYTGDELADADPATEMGAVIKAWLSGSVWKADSATIEWSLYSPATFIEITATGAKYRNDVNWPAAVNFMRSVLGVSSWTTVWTEETPTEILTWEALADHSAVSLSTGCKYIKMSFSGSIPGSPPFNSAAHQLEAVTVTRESTLIPQGSFNAEEGIYFIDAVITNSTSGEWIRIIASLALNTALTIDCLNKIAYTADNAPVGKLEYSSVRKDWLNLAVGSNTLLFEDAGTAGLTFVTNFRDRNN